MTALVEKIAAAAAEIAQREDDPHSAPTPWAAQPAAMHALYLDVAQAILRDLPKPSEEAALAKLREYFASQRRGAQ